MVTTAGSLVVIARWWYMENVHWSNAAVLDGSCNCNVHWFGGDSQVDGIWECRGLILRLCSVHGRVFVVKLACDWFGFETSAASGARSGCVWHRVNDWRWSCNWRRWTAESSDGMGAWSKGCLPGLAGYCSSCFGTSVLEPSLGLEESASSSLLLSLPSSSDSCGRC